VHAYLASTPLSETFNTSKDDLIFQYTVKQEYTQTCGGSYLKLLKEGYDPKNFNGDSDYAVMFGPDMCGPDNRVHVILNYNGQNHLTKKEEKSQNDHKTHFYRLTYSLMIDGEVKADRVPIADHWEIFGPRMIPDKDDKKPADWVEVREIVDVTFVKPENYDSIPRHIPDPAAEKPKDWDAESDGDWEAPEIANPDFYEWKPKMIPNPQYRGEYVPRNILNPDYKEDPEMGHYRLGGVGIDLWQIRSNVLFDDIVVTSDADVANKYLEQWRRNYGMEADVIRKREQDQYEKAKAEKERTENSMRARFEMEDLTRQLEELDEDFQDKKDASEEDHDELDELDEDEKTKKHDEL
ncbi:hypothetical protein BGW38_002651, partial [Lunasporangiospora selenospora]